MTEKKPDKTRLALNSQQPRGAHAFGRIAAPGASQQPTGALPTGSPKPPPKPKK